MRNKENVIKDCKLLLEAYKQGFLGNTDMPEDQSPDFTKDQKESRLCYFTLPMALNYQRNSYSLWDSVLKTYNDPLTRIIFDIKVSANISEDELRSSLIKHKIALQPNKHIRTWQTVSQTIDREWGTLSNLFEFVNYDFLKLQDVVQKTHKKGFPYLSGPKIFHYWSFIIQKYGQTSLKNSEFIQIAPDTHIIRCSILLGVISDAESKQLSKDQISDRWRKLLYGTGINPIDMHAPLWFWSRNNFLYEL